MLLKQAYQSNLGNFPLPLNGDSREITDEIKKFFFKLFKKISKKIFKKSIFADINLRTNYFF